MSCECGCTVPGPSLPHKDGAIFTSCEHAITSELNTRDSTCTQCRIIHERFLQYLYNNNEGVVRIPSCFNKLPISEKLLKSYSLLRREVNKSFKLHSRDFLQ